MVVLHQDQEPVLVQWSKTVQNKRFERMSVRHGLRISHQSQSPSMQSMLVPRACQQHVCPTKAFSEYLVMLHSDQEPVLVQLLTAVQSRGVKRTLVRHGPRASHQSQGKIENANRVINGVCRAMWLSLKNLL